MIRYQETYVNWSIHVYRKCFYELRRCILYMLFNVDDFILLCFMFPTNSLPYNLSNELLTSDCISPPNILRAIVAVIIWKLDLQLHMQSVPITTKGQSSNPVRGEVYSIQQYVIKFVSDLRQVGGFHWVLRFPPPIKIDRHDITEILLKLALNTINNKPPFMVECTRYHNM